MVRATAVAVAVICTSVLMAQERSNTLTAREKAAGWKLLFDGTSLDGWRNYKTKGAPEGWSAVDGTLARVGKGGDIVTTEQYADFELSLEWKVAKGGNSGIFFHVADGGPEVWSTGPEVQVLDNAGHKDGQSAITSAGSNYALHAPVKDVTKPVGEWNTVRLIVRGPHVEQWLNGVKIVEYELWTPDWEKRVQASKFGKMPGYGRAKTGYIALQDHGDPVAFRNIKIRATSPAGTRD